jgi:hypothetical protein
LVFKKFELFLDREKKRVKFFFKEKLSKRKIETKEAQK